MLPFIPLTMWLDAPKALHPQSVDAHTAGYKSSSSQEWDCSGQTLSSKDQENRDAQYSPGRLVCTSPVLAESVWISDEIV